MADPDKHGLSYGHLGKLTYEPASASWVCQRVVGRDVEFCAVEASRTVVSPQILTVGSSDTSNGSSARHRDKQARALARHPELETAVDLISDLARVSAAVGSAAACHDPNHGSLLAVGIIQDEAIKASAQVVAFATGPSGSDIRLVEIQTLNRGWDDSKLAYLKVPSATGETNSWQGLGVPIQQIVFAQPLEKGETLLSVRLLTSTVIFQPVLRSFLTSGNTRLDVNYLTQIDVEPPGGATHSDVTFNPWYTRQLAVIDSAGHWAVWELPGRHDPSPTLMYDGKCRDIDAVSDGSDSGWWRLLWVASPATLAIISRSSLRVVELSAKAAPATDLDVPLSDHNGLAWNLDVVLFPGRPDHLIVLTTSDIRIIKIGTSAFGEPSAKCVLSVVHFLDPQDISLSLRVVTDGDDTLLVVNSGIQSLAVIYRVKVTEQTQLSIGDAIGLELPSGASLGASGISLSHVDFGGKLDQGDCLAIRQMRSGARFVNMTVLRKDLGLEQVLCRAHRRSHALLDRVSPPTWEKRRKAVKSAFKLANDFFIVDDDDDPSGTFVAEAMRERPISAHIERRLDQSRMVSSQNWTIDLHLTAAKLNHVDVEHVTSFDEIFEAADERLRSNSAESQGACLQMLRDLIGGEVTLLDVEDAERRLRNLDLVKKTIPMDLNNDPADAAQQIRQAHFVTTLPKGLEIGLSDLSMTAVYDTVRRYWIAPLQDRMSEFTASAKDQLARRLTAELILASHGIAPEKPAPEAQEESQAPYHDASQKWEHPIRPSVFSSQDLPSSSQSVLPTPSPSATPSAITESSNPSNFAAADTTRLKKYTTFTKSPPTFLPRSLNSILSQWTPGADPTSYDWQRAARILTQHYNADADDADELTEHERRALQRRSERHIRRQRREAHQSQVQDVLSSQAPAIVSASSQQQQPRESAADSYHQHPHPLSASGVPGSSQVSGPLMPASQILPGRHGGRPLAKKKRKLGF